MLSQLAEKYHEKGLRILAVNISGSESPAQIKSYAETANLRQTVLPGGSDVARQYGVRYAPTHVYIDPTGQIVGRHTGVPADLEQRILQILPKS